MLSVCIPFHSWALTVFPFSALLNLIYRHGLWGIPGLEDRPVAMSASTQGNRNSEKNQTCIHMSRGLEYNVSVSEM